MIVPVCVSGWNDSKPPTVPTGNHHRSVLDVPGHWLLHSGHVQRAPATDASPR